MAFQVVRIFGILAAILILGGCAMRSFPAHDGEPAAASATLFPDFGLPVRAWGPEEAETVIVAVHGLNDYSNAFALPAAAWAEAGARTYAFDQRGFGRAPGDGWAGRAIMAADLRDLLNRVRARHPDARLFVVGESVGAAIAVIALADGNDAGVSGLVLSAPAIRPKSSLPLSMRAFGWLAAKLLSGVRIPRDPRTSGATDNRAVLEAMAEDPNIDNAVRLDVFLGVGRAMDLAFRSIPKLDLPVLMLRGEADPIVGRPLTDALFRRFEEAAVPARLISYREGRHLLFRDRDGESRSREALDWMRT